VIPELMKEDKFNSKNNPKVSVVMPCHNSGKTIKQSLDSVLCQTFTEFEVLVCDDHSSDNSLEILESFSDSRIRIFHSERRIGAANARNICLQNARGRFIAFLDSDDLWHKEKLARQIAFMLEHSIPMSYTYYSVIGSIVNPVVKAPSKVDLRKMRFANFMQCLTVMYDRRVFNDAVQPDIDSRNDFAFWLLLMRIYGCEAYCLQEVLGTYRANNSGLSSNSRRSLINFYRCLVRFGNCTFFEGLFYSICYLLIVLMKKKFLKLYNFLVVKL